MTRLQTHSKLHFILALLIAFTLPYGKLTPLFIGLFFVNWLAEGDLVAKFKNLFKNRLALVYISFFLLHIVGLLYTNNMKSGLFDLEVKLSLFIFPLVIASKPFSKKQVNSILQVFVIGLVYASVYMLARATSIYFIENTNAFFYTNFSVVLHSSYMSMYLVFAIFWLVFNMLTRQIATQLKVLSIITITLFSIVIFLMSSKSGIISLVLLFSGLIIYYTIAKKKYLVSAIAGLSLVALMIAVYSFIPQVKVRIDNFTEAITIKSNNQTSDSTSDRILIWQSANQIIKNNFIVGVGTGDVKDALSKEYKENKIAHALEHKFNAHNEFYQVFIGFGIVGFILFLIHLFYPLKITFVTKDYLYMVFLLIICFNFLSESMLETKAGVMFFAFFNAILCFQKRENSV